MIIPINIDSIIFDMDGVLMLSCELHATAFKKIFSEIGITLKNYSDYAGMRTDEVFFKVLKQNDYNDCSTKIIKELTEKKRAEAQKLLKEKLNLADGVIEVIKTLSKKYKLGLASSASPQTINIFFEKSGLRDCFSCAINGTMIENAKPAPDIYLLALKELNSKKQNSLVIEDAVSGIKSAKSAGLTVFGITGTDTEENLILAGADKVLTKLKDLLETEF
ncbi:MAG TPA: HAD family phosphatase [bacterium]|nr:HAD family phosphatase [bacterium]HPN32066.1 HAD family phosphatase [bacterium]